MNKTKKGKEIQSLHSSQDQR